MRSLLLGVDTGGTYTDAVLIEVSQTGDYEVVAKAKALTTRHDLAIGIGESLDAVLAESDAQPWEIQLCSVSTTLATNALVEGHGGRVALVAVGFSDDDLKRAGLNETLGSDAVVRVQGGHDAYGLERSPLDLDQLFDALQELSPQPAGYAVVGQFAVRNPAHELAIRDHIRSVTDSPVTCSHELTAKLNGPRRALTSLLNARLIPLIGSLLSAASGLLDERNIDAPLMVVRGDGTLLSVEVARTRPIETILSGPAASVIGASFLTDAPNAIVSDIGGTTTDIAILRNGKPRLDTEGATVGGHRTMVEAVAMDTFGLGGDSEVRVNDVGQTTELSLGPGRVVPISILASQFGDAVLKVLERESLSDLSRERDGQFGLLARPDAPLDDDERVRDIVSKLGEGPVCLNDLLPTKRHELTLDRLVRTGVVLRCGFTPTDACHVLGLHTQYSEPAARMAAALFARQRDRRADVIDADAENLCQRVVDRLVRESGQLVLGAALASDGFRDSELAKSALAQAGLDRHSGLVKIDVGVAVPLIGLGASAATYYPAVANLLGAELVLSPHAGVANAVGAVVGHVAMTARAAITPLKNGRFRSHAGTEQQDFDSPGEATDHAVDFLGRQMTAAAIAAGAVEPVLEVSQDKKVVRTDGADLFVESTVTVTATGRPRLGAAGS